MKLRVGLIGLGNVWEKRYLPALRALGERFEVRAVCEPVGRLAELAAMEFGASVVDGYQVLVKREDIDVAVILSADWFGPLPLLAASDAGKAVYFGGQLNLSWEEAQAVRQRVEASGVAFMAELPRRQSPATLRLKELIATVLGPPRLLFCHHRLPLVPDDAECAAPRRCAPSPAQELVELVDWCRYVVGSEPRWVTGVAEQSDPREPSEAYQMLSLDFSGEEGPGAGPVAQISCGRYIPSHWEEAISYRPLAGMQISCERGIAFVDLPASIVWFDEAGRHQESLETERPVGEQLLTQFYRAVTSLVSRTCSLHDMHRALFVLEQARNSFRQGRRIAL